MKTVVEGFSLEVTVQDFLPHVRVSFRDGRIAVDTSAVSVTGLERLAGVFEMAARLAALELEQAYDTVRTRRAHNIDSQARALAWVLCREGKEHKAARRADMRPGDETHLDLFLPGLPTIKAMLARDTATAALSADEHGPTAQALKPWLACHSDANGLLTWNGADARL